MLQKKQSNKTFEDIRREILSSPNLNTNAVRTLGLKRGWNNSGLINKANTPR